MDFEEVGESSESIWFNILPSARFSQYDTHTSFPCSRWIWL